MLDVKERKWKDGALCWLSCDYYYLPFLRQVVLLRLEEWGKKMSPVTVGAK